MDKEDQASVGEERIAAARVAATNFMVDGFGLGFEFKGSSVMVMAPPERSKRIFPVDGGGTWSARDTTPNEKRYSMD